MNILTILRITSSQMFVLLKLSDGSHTEVSPQSNWGVAAVKLRCRRSQIEVSSSQTEVPSSQTEVSPQSNWGVQQSNWGVLTVKLRCPRSQTEVSRQSNRCPRSQTEVSQTAGILRYITQNIEWFTNYVAIRSYQIISVKIVNTFKFLIKFILCLLIRLCAFNEDRWFN